MSDKAVRFPSDGIDKLLARLHEQISPSIPDESGAVDVRLTISSIDITKKGFWVFKKTSKKTSIQLELTTRIRPSKQESPSPV